MVFMMPVLFKVFNMGAMPGLLRFIMLAVFAAFCWLLCPLLSSCRRGSFPDLYALSLAIIVSQMLLKRPQADGTGKVQCTHGSSLTSSRLRVVVELGIVAQDTERVAVATDIFPAIGWHHRHRVDLQPPDKETHAGDIVASPPVL